MYRNKFGIAVALFALSISLANAEPKPIKIEGELPNGISTINTTRLNTVFKNSAKITHITFHHEGYAGKSKALFEKRRITREPKPALTRVGDIHGSPGNDGHYKKFGMLAYHYVVGMDGEIVKGRPIKYKPGTHSPYDFAGHFAVVALGDFDHESLREKALNSYVRVMSEAQRAYHVPTDNIRPHKHYHKSNFCPGENIYQRRHEITRRVMIHSVQAELIKRGCEGVGKVDGREGPKTRRAFRRFAKQNHIALKSGKITDAALMKMLKNPTLRCD